MKLVIRELKDFIRFFWKVPKTERYIVFYSEHEGYYPNFEGIIYELINTHRQTFCYITSDPNDPILQTPQTKIKSFYFNRLLPFFMVLVNCRAFVMTMTDLNQLHLKRSANPVHYFYVFHSLVSTHMMYLEGAFDHYDTVLCVGPHHVAEIRKREKLAGLPAKNLIEAGYYRLERIYQSYRRYAAQPQSHDEKPTVLIAPSWGDENLLESCGERLIEALLKTGHKVIARPHPETVRRSPELMTSFRSRFGDNPDFTLETSVATDDSMLKADVLICDCSGIALEYAFGTERPVLFVDLPLKIRNPKYRDLGIEPLELALRDKIGVVISPDNIDSIPPAIERLRAETELYEKIIRELRAKNVYAFGRSSEIGAQRIIDSCQGQKQRKGNTK